MFAMLSVNLTDKSKTEAEKRRAAKAQFELEAFGEVHKPRGRLFKHEVWRSQHYEWLIEQGYLL